MAILDHTLPLQIKAPNMMRMLDQGSQLAQFYTQQKSDGELARLYKESNGDLDKMMEIGKQSPLARFVMPKLQEQQAAQQKALLDQQKIEADIGKTKSEAFKNNQQGDGYGLDNAGKLLASANQALTVAAQTGDPRAARLALNNSLKAGAITPELYAQFDEQIKLIGNDPEALKKYAQSIVLAQSKDPDKYLFTSADTVANNAQSDINNQRSTNASIYSTDVSAETANKNRAQQQNQFDANLYVQQNKPLDYFTAADGTRYAVYANGQGIPVSGPTGDPVKAQQPNANNSTVQKAILETDDTVSATKNAITNLKDALKYSATAYDGVGAAQRATARGFFGEDERAVATTMLDNIVTGNALEMLKATFGGAPTEGERAILLQLQGSANLPKAQREAIYTRAIQMAESRLASNQQKSNQLRSGTYFSQQQGVPYANAGQQNPSGGAKKAQSFFD